MLAAPPALRAQPARMRLSHQYPLDHHIARMLAAFAEDATARRAGIEVEVFPAERLARVAENVPGVARGAFEAAVATNFTWGNTIPKTRAPTIPFLFTELGRIEEFPGSRRRVSSTRHGAARRALGRSALHHADVDLHLGPPPDPHPRRFPGLRIRGINPLIETGLRAVAAAPAATPAPGSWARRSPACSMLG